MVATTPAAILETTKIVPIAMAVAIKTSLNSITVSMTALTLLPHSIAEIWDLLRPAASPFWPVNPLTKLCTTGTTLVKM